MRKYNIPPAFSSSLQLGRQGENGVTEITFLCAGYAKMYGDGFAEAVHRTPDGTTYPVNIEQDENNRVSWLISDGDTATAGTGQLELRWMVNGNLAKSKIFSTIIKSALTAPETPPDAAKSWVDKVLKAAEDIKEGAIDDEKLAKAIAQYLEKHPIQSGITEQKAREIAQSIVDAYQEKDPTVPDWAKAETKPTYTAAEVGAVPESAKSDIEKNTSARHTHSNKSALDSISESDIAKWNSGTAGTVEITGATGLAAGSAPTVTETADSTAQARKYTLGIPAGENGADGAKGEKGETGAKGDKGEQGADGKSAYQFAQEAGYTGTETEFAEKLAEEMPDALPNPNALTFTGAVSGTYDGSTAVSVEIPSGGSGGKSTIIFDSGEITEEVNLIGPIDVSKYSRLRILGKAYPSENSAGKKPAQLYFGNTNHRLLCNAGSGKLFDTSGNPVSLLIYLDVGANALTTFSFSGYNAGNTFNDTFYATSSQATTSDGGCLVYSTTYDLTQMYLSAQDDLSKRPWGVGTRIMVIGDD